MPKLESIQLGCAALRGNGRDDRRTIYTLPFNYRNTLTMKRENEWNDEWRDLPSLTTFKGDKMNFKAIGSVILESTDLSVDRSRYPPVVN